jgi:hypothetical protein
MNSMMTRDSLRLAKTSARHSHIGPLHAVQQFTVEAVGGTQSPDNMRPGLRISNSRRISDKTRGQSAGV